MQVSKSVFKVFLVFFKMYSFYVFTKKLVSKGHRSARRLRQVDRPRPAAQGQSLRRRLGKKEIKTFFKHYYIEPLKKFIDEL